MARKTFISYKYDEAQDLRNRIIEALKDGATYYQGETSDSPDLTDLATETIKKRLKDMIFDTSVMIVIISPRMNQSNWIEWEISYALKEYKRGGTRSHTNGVVGVVMKDYFVCYDWIKRNHDRRDGCKTISYEDCYMPDIINKNRFNQTPKEYSCDHCKSVDALTGSYISLVTEEGFLCNPSKYIENAYEKSKNINQYVIRRSQ